MLLKNNNDLSVLPIKNKKIAIVLVFKRFIKGNYSNSFVNKRQNITYDGYLMIKNLSVNHLLII